MLKRRAETPSILLGTVVFGRPENDYLSFACSTQMSCSRCHSQVSIGYVNPFPTSNREGCCCVIKKSKSALEV